MIMLKKLTVCGLCLLLLAACSRMETRQRTEINQITDDQRNVDRNLKLNSVQHPRIAGHRDAAVIPGVDRVKTQTTNQHGASGYGMGHNVLSRIGSSSLHSPGISSQLESRLGGAGMPDVRVFVFDDKIILASNGQEYGDAVRYDSLQRKVLSSTGGLSGKGPEPGRQESVGIRSDAGAEAGPAAEPADRLAEAERWIRENVGGADIHTIVGPEAAKAIDRIRSEGDAGAAAKEIAEEIANLLRMATAQGNNK